MASANSNAIEPIPEEIHAESQSAESEAAPPASGTQQTETDKYDDVTDPIVLCKARAVAKSKHTRTITLADRVRAPSPQGVPAAVLFQRPKQPTHVSL